MKPNKSKHSQKKIVLTSSPEKKQDVLKHQVDSNKVLKVADFLGKIMLISGVVVAIAYFFVNIAINSWSISYSAGVPQIPYGEIIGTSLFILGLGALIWVIAHSIVYAKAGIDITTRFNETIEMDDSDVRYTYTTKKNSTAKEVVAVPLNTVIVQYDPKARKIEFSGSLKIAHISHVDGKPAITNLQLNEFVIYDYFEPSLHLKLQKASVKFKSAKEEDDYV